MEHRDVIIIGAGQAGLAMSRCLGDRGIDHLVLERGKVAERWRTQRWDSLRLLTPNWQSRLPGFRYDGDDPHGYMRAREVVDYLARYAASFEAPIRDETSVRSVYPNDAGYRVVTDRGSFSAPNVVIATGHCDVPFVPGAAGGVARDIHQITADRYKSPVALPEGGVLVVGAAATGLQLADELRRAGRDVTLAVGRHSRVPRCYRGRDIMWWLDAMGTLDRRFDEVRDLEAARREPSLQLVGRPDHRTCDLRTLRASGVRLVGRFRGADGSRVHFADDLREQTAAADVKLARLLARIDAFADQADIATRGGPVPAPPVVPPPAPNRLDLRREGIATILWATGFRRDYSWLDVPLLDRRGEIVHRGGITAAPGLYVLGLGFMRRRKSTFIDGVGDDARDLARHIHAHLGKRGAAAA